MTGLKSHTVIRENAKDDFARELHSNKKNGARMSIAVMCPVLLLLVFCVQQIEKFKENVLS